MNIISIFEVADRYLFHLVNRDLSADWLDGIMKLFRNPYIWIPLYFFLLFWFYKNARRYLFLIIFFSIITLVLTDYISSGILKPMLKRPRPCYVAELNTRSVVGCGGLYGTPSSHASNHFGLAAFWFTVIADIRRKKIYWLWLWAFIICYAQVYVGVHYPSDMLFGAILGIGIAVLTSRLFHYSYSRLFRKKNTLSLRKSY